MGVSVYILLSVCVCVCTLVIIYVAQYGIPGGTRCITPAGTSCIALQLQSRVNAVLVLLKYLNPGTRYYYYCFKGRKRHKENRSERQYTI